MDPERYQRVKNLCQSALDMDRERREAYLEQACAGDESLRKDVEALLTHQTEAEDFMQDPAMEVAAKALARDPVVRLGVDLSGRRVAHYQIVGKIGEGGMGEVYRARDTRLIRDVAIKVLPESFSEDHERVTRFEREARLLATLNHPNIASVYGLEEVESRSYLVMELVEGKTLGERLKKGRIRLEETLEICRQIAVGLEAAHERGIIHRDLKPSNIKITPEGKVKVLDFGLARALYDQAASADLSHSPTINDEMTRPGVVLGTASYMSPEQAKGKAVDKRADIWAFGCVLYECLTGKRLFHGDTTTETAAAILKSEPDWALLPGDTPLFLRSLLRRCLQKDPNLRLRDIGDARIEMGESVSQPLQAVALPRRLLARSLLALAVAGPIAGILIGAGLMWHFRPVSSLAVLRAVVRLEPGQWFECFGLERPTRTAISISSDGGFIVYSATTGSPEPQTKPQLYLRRTDQMDAKPIAGTEGGIGPFLSPDNRWVGFWVGGNLRKVSLDGGVPVPLCKGGYSLGASWGPDNRIVFSPHTNTGLFRVSADGGKPEALTTPDKTKEASHRLPHCLPDGKGVLFTVMRERYDYQPRTALLDLKTLKWRDLIEDAADARYVPTGHLVFLRQGTLMAVRFDIDRLEVTGQPVPAITNVMQAHDAADEGTNTAAGQFSISSSGLLLYASGGITPDHMNSMVWVDQKGTAQEIADFKAPFDAVRLSPDGRLIAYLTLGREWRLSLYDLNRRTPATLIGEGKTMYFIWTRDGKRVIFNWTKSGPYNLWWQPVDGSLPMERLTTSEYNQFPGSLTPDGDTLAFVEEHPDTGLGIYLLDLRNRRVTPFLNTKAGGLHPEFSPDGRWMAYTCGEVYVRPFPGPGGKSQVSGAGGREPLWSRNGKQLFYRSEGGEQAWIVDVRTDTGFSASKPRLLFEKQGFIPGSPIRGWDLSPDGQRFLMVKEEERKPRPVTELILVQNWFEELKRLVPTGEK